MRHGDATWGCDMGTQHAHTGTRQGDAAGVSLCRETITNTVLFEIEQTLPFEFQIFFNLSDFNNDYTMFSSRSASRVSVDNVSLVACNQDLKEC